MANKIANRVKMTVASVASSGTGDITLGSSLSGYLTFAEGGVSNADTVPYVLEAANGDWEIGVGTYTSSGTVLARTTVTKSAIGGVVGTSKITASSTTIVMISPLAADLQAGTAAGNLVQLDSNASIPVSNGGTGLTSLTAGYIPYGNGTGAFSSSAGLLYNGAQFFIGGASSSYIYLTAGGTNYGLLYADNSRTQLEALQSLPLTFWTGSTERARIDASGNLLVGTTTSIGRINSATGSSAGSSSITDYCFAGGSDTYRMCGLSEETSSNTFAITNRYSGSGVIAFRSWNGSALAERARIDSSGNLLVGTTSSLGGIISAVKNDNGTSSPVVYLQNAGGSAGFISFSDSTAVIGSITRVSSAISYNTTSDISLKDNISNAPSALQSILNMSIRQWDWKSDGSHVDYGWVAQEAYEHAPEAITQGDLWQADYGRVTPRLIKAFQEAYAELSAKVTALEARI